MRIGDLARRTGIPVGTIKFYLREGLLPPGERTARNQADYGDGHLERLELIRALRDGAGLSLAAIGRTFAVMDEQRDRRRPDHLTTAIAALSGPAAPGEATSDEHQRAERDVDELLSELGWDVDPTSPGRADLVRALVAVHRYLPGLIEHPRQLRAHADAVRRLAEVEIPDGYDPGVEPMAVLRYSVLGTVLFEPVLLALRKLAHVDRIRHLDTAPPDRGGARRTSGRQAGRGRGTRPVG